MQRLQQSSSAYSVFRHQLQDSVSQFQAGLIGSDTARSRAEGYVAALNMARSTRPPAGKEIQDDAVIQNLLKELNPPKSAQREGPGKEQSPGIAFGCKATAALFRGEKVGRLESIRKPAVRKLQELSQAKTLADLKGNGNKLEKLRAAGETYSIRINDQWRILFEWQDRAVNVRIANYH